MAGRGLGTLTLDLILKMGGFEQGLDKAGRALDKRGKQMEARAKSIGRAIGIGLTAGLAVGGALATGIKLTIDRMDELSKAAQRVSLPTEDFSRLAYAGDLADVSIQDLQSSFAKLVKSQSDANDGATDQAKIFNALGIAIKNADGSLRDSKALFYDFADKFQQLNGSPEATAAGLNIFGRSFQNLIPLLKDGSQGLQDAADEADRLGITLSTEAGESAEKFNDDITRLKTKVKGLWQEIVEGAIPGLIEASDKMVNFARNADDASTSAKDFGKSMGDLGKDIAGAIPALFDFIGLLRDLPKYNEQFANSTAGLFNTVLGNLAPGKLGDFFKDRAAKNMEDAFGNGNPFNASKMPPIKVPVLGTVTVVADPKAISKAEAEAKRIKDAINAALGGTEPRGSKTGSSKKSDAERAAEQLQRAYDSLVASQKEQIALFGETSEAAKARYDTELGALKDLPAAQKAVIVANAERLDQMAQEKALQDAADAAVQRNSEAYARQREAIKGQIGDMQFELQLLGLSNVEREKAIALRYAGADATDAERAAIGKLAEQLDAARKANDLYNEAQRSLSDAMFDAISGAKSLKDAFLDLVDNIEAAILRSITDNWAEKIGSWFKGANSSGSSDNGGGGFWAGLIGSLFGGGKASGGTVMPGKFYRVAENGPEMLSMGGRQYLMTGNQSGRVDPNPNMGRGLTVNQTLVSQTPFTMRSAMQLQQEAAFKLRQATARS